MSASQAASAATTGYEGRAVADHTDPSRNPTIAVRHYCSCGGSLVGHPTVAIDAMWMAHHTGDGHLPESDFRRGDRTPDRTWRRIGRFWHIGDGVYACGTETILSRGGAADRSWIYYDAMKPDPPQTFGSLSAAIACALGLDSETMGPWPDPVASPFSDGSSSLPT